LADKNFQAQKGLTVANTVIYTSGSNVGFSNTSPAHTVSVSGDAYVSGNVVITKIVANGALGNTTQMLLSNSTGGLYWANQSTTSTPGSNTQVIYNDSGTSNGSSGLVWTKTSNTLTVSNTITVININVGNSTTGYISIPSAAGGGWFLPGTGDGANSTVYNSILRGWYGMAFQDYANTVTGVLDFRTGGLNMTGVVNAASHTVGSSFVANTLGAYSTGVVNASSLTVGSSIVANTTKLTLASTVGLQANGSVGSNGHVLTSNGSIPYWAALAGGGSLIGMQTLTSGTTYTKATGATKLIVIGTGGGSDNNFDGGDYYSGHAGGTFITFVNIGSNTTITYAIGAGGTSTGANGGATSFGASGGYGYAQGGYWTSTVGGSGGAASNGTINIFGGTGPGRISQPPLASFWGGYPAYGTGALDGSSSSNGVNGVIVVFEFA
jgi:hypothetical protein